MNKHTLDQNRNKEIKKIEKKKEELHELLEEIIEDAFNQTTYIHKYLIEKYIFN